MLSLRRRKRSAFTLVELVVVVVIIAILAAVAVPKFFDRAGDAKKSAAMQSLATLRSAIELYRADGTAYPTTLETDLGNYLKGPFPGTKVGGVNSNAVIYINGNRPLAASDLDSTGGWVYNSTTGEIRINHSDFFSY
ncbi:MAG: prepilin-type N-terminal cleavage/methylation domain-containing protein [Aureliella sp.]